MAPVLEVDRYGGSFARVRVTGHDATDGVTFTAPIVLAEVAGPNGELLADVAALEALGGAMWYDAGGTLGKMTDGTDDVTATNAGLWISGGYTITAHHDAGTGGHPNLIVELAAAPEPPADPPGDTPAKPNPPLWPITGLDVATALGLPAATPAMDDAALVSCQLLGEYLDRDKVLALPELPQPIVEACLVIAIDVLQNRTAAGGQSVGIDGSVGPYRMGRSLLDRVSGLLGPWLDQQSELG